MSMIREDVEERYVGVEAVDRSEAPVGEVRQVFVDEETERPLWASVRVALLDSEVLVPLDDADWDDRSLHLPIAGRAILDAPRGIGADGPSERDQERLYTHYGIPTVRTPRVEEVLAAVETEGVCYSLHDRAAEELETGAEVIREAEQAPPATVTGHML